MKYLIITILGLIITLSSFAQNNGDKVGPVIKFEKKTHDFGELEDNTTATYKFKFTNEGDVPLVFQKVQASCGCTTPKYSQQPIMPGKSDFITVGFRTRGYGGRSFSKQITVVTNAKENSPSKMIILTIKGKVKKKPVEQKPPQSPVRLTPSK